MSVPNATVNALAPSIEPPYTRVRFQSTATSTNVGAAAVAKALRSASRSPGP